MINKKIRALFIFEVLGRPPDYLKTALESHISKLDNIKGISLENKTFHEPKKIEKKPEESLDENKEKERPESDESNALYSSFAEVEILADDLEAVLSITLGMLPAHVEIIEPENISLNNHTITDLLSAMSVKLHKYDEVARIIGIQRTQLLKKMKKMQEELNSIKPKDNENKIKNQKDSKIKK